MALAKSPFKRLLTSAVTDYISLPMIVAKDLAAFLLQRQTTRCFR